MSANFKKEKIQEKIQFFALECIRNFSDTRLGLLSITKVELSSDMSSAKIFWDTFDAEKRENITEALSANKGKIRSYIGRGLKIKHTPLIDFFYDNQFDEEQKISQLLKSEGHLNED